MPADARWQRGQAIEAIYLADSPDTAWAEWYRWLAEAGLPPNQGLPRDLWKWEVSLVDVADVSDDRRLGRIGLPALKPTRAQWKLFQPKGEAIYAAGHPALVAASAARPAGQVLCVFREHRLVPGIKAVVPPERVDRAPVPPRGMTT